LPITNRHAVGRGEDEFDLADFLRTKEVVFEGVFIGVDTLHARMTVGGCGMGPMGPYKSLDLHVRVTRVLQGTVDDSVMVVATLGWPQFRQEKSPGSQVLV
jgi:hypothetical protein